jgi:Flp pilus assembly protein TadG
MRKAFGSGKRRDAQTLVFFLLAWGTIMLLCGLAIDSGLLFLAKARMGRAVDGASLAAVGNFNRNSDPVANRDDVATIMRNFATANFTDLATIATSGSSTPGGTPTPYTLSNGGTGTTYTYNFNDGTTDANGQFRRFVQVQLNTGSGGNITSASCNARCPVQTYFIGYATYAINGRKNVKIGGYSGPSGLVDLKVSSSAVASRNPRLIMVVVDRSASMLQPGGGAFGLPQSVVQFLDFFDTSSDYIGIVSFATSARLEMPLTTNFIVAATNVLFDSYQIATNSTQTNAVPGVDPEELPSSGLGSYDPNYATIGIRRMKFGGQTAADEGIRLAMEQMMANSGFNDPDVVKYLVLFTDGKWNESRTLVAAPGYTNWVTCPASGPYSSFSNNGTAKSLTNGAPGAWNSANLTWNTNLVTVPNMSPMPDVTNAIGTIAEDYSVLRTNHYNDVWQSIDSSGYEPLKNPSAASASPGDTLSNTDDTYVGNSGTTPLTNYYTHYLDVWLPPGSVDYLYHAGSLSNNGVFVSDYTNPDQTINIYLKSGDVNELVVPGYVVDGCVYDGLDLPYANFDTANFPKYRADNYNQPFMWPDDTVPLTTSAQIYNYCYNGTPGSTSLERSLMFRNYVNLLTGFYVNRPDEPLSTATEPLDDTTPPTHRPFYGLGAYYPSAGFYWPFDGVGIDYDPTYGLANPTSDPDISSPYLGVSRHAAYSINMLSTNATPEWSGELFYKSISGSGTNVVSGPGTTSASTLMTTKADWQAGAPQWLLNDFDVAGENVMGMEATHNTNIAGSPSVWRPLTYNGSNTLVGTGLAGCLPTDAQNYTGGYVTDGKGNYYRNAMAWSGRPTHYFDFSQAKWVAVANNHVTNAQFLGIGSWKAQEYAWHARALGVTIYTVGYGQKVSPDQQVLLAKIANSTNTTAGNSQTWNGSSVTNYVAGPGTAITYNPSQPIGQQFYATNIVDISNDFYLVGQAINAALTQ